MKWLKEKWSKLPLETRKELTSALQTFLATFFATLAAQFQGEVEWTATALFAACVAAIRTALKGVFNHFLLK